MCAIHTHTHCVCVFFQSLCNFVHACKSHFSGSDHLFTQRKRASSHNITISTYLWFTYYFILVDQSLSTWSTNCTIELKFNVSESKEWERMKTNVFHLGFLFSYAAAILFTGENALHMIENVLCCCTCWLNAQCTQNSTR